MDIKNTLADNLRLIRKETGLNQADFFEKYLSDVISISTRDKTDDKSPKPIPSLETMQKRMREYENGQRSLPAEALPILSKLSGRSINDLLGYDSDGETPVERDRNKTVSDVLSVLFDIDKVVTIELREIQVAEDYYRSSSVAKHPCIIFRSSEMKDALIEWNELRQSSIQGTLKDTIMRTWKKGILSQYKQSPVEDNLDMISGEKSPF